MLEDLDLAPGSFDAITLLQVVEHMPDARPLLAACRALLRDGGALLVATPNPASLLARAKRERFNYWIPPIHCAWYTPPALGRLLEGAGYELARSATWSPRTDKLHDGRDILDASRIGRRMPYRLKRRAADWVARAADATGNGTMTELVALKRGTR